jgi:hypothetical protein
VSIQYYYTQNFEWNLLESQIFGLFLGRGISGRKQGPCYFQNSAVGDRPLLNSRVPATKVLLATVSFYTILRH